MIGVLDYEKRKNQLYSHDADSDATCYYGNQPKVFPAGGYQGCGVKDSNSYTVYFHNLEGSAFQGLIYNRLREDKGKVILEFGSDAKGKDGILVPPV